MRMSPKVGVSHMKRTFFNQTVVFIEFVILLGQNTVINRLILIDM